MFSRKNCTAKLTNTSTRMRKVAISETVFDKVSELRAFLTDELKLSREAAHGRTDRINAFLKSLAGAADYPCAASKMASARTPVCRIRERLGFRLRSIRRWYHYTGYVPYCHTERVKMIRFKDSTSEKRWALDITIASKSVTIEPKKQEAKHTDAWDKAIAEGAISADAFFDELNSRIDNGRIPCVR